MLIILCLGVLKYGVGTWEEAKADLELELSSKILSTSDDATPQVNTFSILHPLRRHRNRRRIRHRIHPPDSSSDRESLRT